MFLSNYMYIHVRVHVHVHLAVVGWLGGQPQAGEVYGAVQCCDGRVVHVFNLYFDCGSMFWEECVDTCGV